ncbi:heparan-alpha-glucosaminide N-acetyltransferase domain-containing protein [Thermopolyspora sp. NPDC052614]|uniref:heparan-alpha-glucosaminide N-acetyltransferase domain-containing protein n=1 Tax=Thermopolyspora sp. NPDC052614 TaxID=3155682 RepID=UPI0034357822
MRKTDPTGHVVHGGRTLTRGDGPAQSSARPSGEPAGRIGPDAPVRERPGRLLGVDLARGMAIFGMFAVHVGPSPANVGGLPGLLLRLAQGRSAALFATLAGLSLVLMSGRDRTHKPGREVRTRIGVRAVILLLLGTGLTMLGTTISVIIPYYGVFFLMALPVLGFSAAALAVLAAVAALAGPVLTMAPMVIPGDWLDTFASYDPINSLSGRGFIDLVLVGAFPAACWIAYVFAGMALARLDLAAAGIRRRLVAAGVALTVTGYGGSWLATHVFTHVQEAVDQAAAAASAAGSSFDVFDEGSPIERLLVASPHSNSPFEIIGNLGVVILAIVASIAALEARPRLRRLAAPVIAVGTMSLTVYVAHILVIHYVDPEVYLGTPLAVLVAFIAGATAFAVLWRRWFRRGPLEFLLHFSAIKLARVVR